jgi:acetolactate synthase-1/2/3 large subunit
MMAHAYSRLSGKPGVCMAISGPRTIRMATGGFKAFVEACPMMVSGGASTLNPFSVEESTPLLFPSGRGEGEGLSWLKLSLPHPDPFPPIGVRGSNVAMHQCGRWRD